MQCNKVHHIHTVGRVAKNLGVDEDLIHDLTLGLEPEDSVIWVYGVDDGDGTVALTDEGVAEVERLLADTAASGRDSPNTSAAVRTGWIHQARHQRVSAR
jgi:hypothetical protein